MSNKKRDFILIGIFICGILTSCNFPLTSNTVEVTPTPLSDIEILATTVAQTLSVLQIQMQEQQATEAPAPTAVPTTTTEAVNTGDPGNPGANQPAAQTTDNTQVCYLASSVSESYPDNTVVSQDEEFTKSWTLKNAGTCNWSSGFKLVYASGYQMSGDSPQYLGSEIAPGGTATFSVDMQAPSADGTYQGNWELQTSDGATFAYVWVKIVVSDDSDEDFAVTSVDFSYSDTIEGTCPYDYYYSADITTSDEGDVYYYFINEDDSTTDENSITFDEADTITVDGSRTFESSGSYWIKLYIDEPNNQVFGKVKISVDCD